MQLACQGTWITCKRTPRSELAEQAPQVEQRAQQVVALFALQAQVAAEAGQAVDHLAGGHMLQADAPAPGAEFQFQALEVQRRQRPLQVLVGRQALGQARAQGRVAGTLAAFHALAPQHTLVAQLEARLAGVCRRPFDDELGEHQVHEELRLGPLAQLEDQPAVHRAEAPGAGLQVLAALVESKAPASELLRQFEPLPQLLKNVRFNGGAEPLEADSVRRRIAAAEAELEGKGRLVIRKSGTEPLIRVMAEGDDPKLVERVVDDICEAVRTAA